MANLMSQAKENPGWVPPGCSPPPSNPLVAQCNAPMVETNQPTQARYVSMVQIPTGSADDSARAMPPPPPPPLPTTSSARTHQKSAGAKKKPESDKAASHEEHLENVDRETAEDEIEKVVRTVTSETVYLETTGDVPPPEEPTRVQTRSQRAAQKTADDSGSADTSADSTRSEEADETILLDAEPPPRK